MLCFRCLCLCRSCEPGFNEGETLETLDFTFCSGSTPTYLYFDLHVSHCLHSTLCLFH